MTLIIAVFALVLALWTTWQFFVSKRQLLCAVVLVALISYVVLLHFSFDFPSFPNVISKGEANADVRPLVLALFLCMLVGMGAEYLYHYLDSQDAKFNWKSFAKPFLISPLVFVPLAASLQNAKIDLSQFDIPVLMLFLVAFENGFLWRGYFTRKLSQSQEGLAADKNP